MIHHRINKGGKHEYSKNNLFCGCFLPWCYAFAPTALRIEEEFPDIPEHVVGDNLVSPATSLLWLRIREPGLTQFWRSVEEETGRSFEGALSNLANQKDARMDSVGAKRHFFRAAATCPPVMN